MTQFAQHPQVNFPQQLIDRGFIDNSWSNDAAPRAELKLGNGLLVAWVNYPNAVDREPGMDHNFGLEVANDEGQPVMLVGNYEHLDDMIVVIDAFIEANPL